MLAVLLVLCFCVGWCGRPLGGFRSGSLRDRSSRGRFVLLIASLLRLLLARNRISWKGLAGPVIFENSTLFQRSSDRRCVQSADVLEHEWSRIWASDTDNGKFRRCTSRVCRVLVTGRHRELQHSAALRRPLFACLLFDAAAAVAAASTYNYNTNLLLPHYTSSYSRLLKSVRKGLLAANHTSTIYRERGGTQETTEQTNCIYYTSRQ